MPASINRSFFINTHFTDDETEARRPVRGPARGPSSQRAKNELEQLLQGWQMRSFEPALPLQTTRKAKTGGKKNLLTDHGELTKQGRMTEPRAGRRQSRQISLAPGAALPDHRPIPEDSWKSHCQPRGSRGEKSGSKAHLFGSTGGDLHGLHARNKDEQAVGQPPISSIPETELR